MILTNCGAFFVIDHDGELCIGYYDVNRKLNIQESAIQNSNLRVKTCVKKRVKKSTIFFQIVDINLAEIHDEITAMAISDFYTLLLTRDGTILCRRISEDKFNMIQLNVPVEKIVYYTHNCSTYIITKCGRVFIYSCDGTLQPFTILSDFKVSDICPFSYRFTTSNNELFSYFDCHERRFLITFLHKCSRLTTYATFGSNIINNFRGSAFITNATELFDVILYRSDRYVVFQDISGKIHIDDVHVPKFWTDNETIILIKVYDCTVIFMTDMATVYFYTLANHTLAPIITIIDENVAYSRLAIKSARK